MPLPNTGALLAYKNHVLDHGEFTPITGTWPTNPPIGHMASLQLPTPHALVTPNDGEIEFTWAPHDAEGNPIEITIDTLALLAHTLPAGAVIEYLNDTTKITDHTWAPLTNRDRPPNAYTVLPAAETVETLRIKITNAGNDPVRIGGLWASESIRECIDRGWGIDTNDHSVVSRVNATPWPNRRTQVDSVPGVMDMITEDQAYGINGGPNLKNLFEAAGTYSPVIYMPRTGSTEHIAHLAIYGLLQRGYAIQHRGGAWFRGRFEVEEIR